MRFIDEVEIIAASGSGGAGCASFRREKHVPRGGPDGGDGGRGGQLIFRATSRRNTLQDFRRNKVYCAGNGRPGKGRQRHGANGEDVILEVPVGTVLFDAASDEQLADLDEAGLEHVLPGGAGGLGNIHFKSSRNRTPRERTLGSSGVEMRIRLELKLIADVGLVGFPNAGKSTLLSKITAAKPRIGAHPFTTLVPQLGVVAHGDEAFVVADIPGLIEGASEGRGLGLEFLRHIERCEVFLHLVCPTVDEGEPVDRVRALEAELGSYDAELLERPRLLVLTKIDLLDADERASWISRLESEIGLPCIAASAVTGEGLSALVRATGTMLGRARGELD